ncbi:MAG: DUF401 family protein [Planctomycetota bacterium]|jgi:integral membrane protein (TIGR00529 family)
MFALVKVFAVFTIVVLMIRMMAPLGVSFVCGTILVVFFFGMGVQEGGEAFFDIFVQPGTDTFVLIIALVLALSMVMEKSGQIDRLTASLRTFVTNSRIACAILPSIVGFLPMPGGALFSAPMVRAATADLVLDNDRKSEINHWFRHVWEYSWPLYPGIIYAADILKIEVKMLLLIQFPLTVMAIITGFIFIIRKVRVSPDAAAPEPAPKFRAFMRFLLDMSPFLIIFVLYLIVNLPILWSLASALALAVVMNVVRGKVKFFPLVRGIITSRHYMNFIIMAYGVKFFGEMLVRSGAVAEISAFFISINFPVLVLVAALPFVIGFVAGIAIVFCTTAFPLLLALPAVAADPVPYIVLAFTAGFMGTMLSPLHACLVLTNEYFKSSLLRVILRLVRPAISVLATSVALYFLYSRWKPF